MTPKDDPQTVFLFLTDSHIGGTRQGFQQQPRHTELREAIFDGVGRAAREQGAELVIHGGDLTDHGTPQEIAEAHRLLEKVGVPAAFCMGNHDLMTPEAMDSWKGDTPAAHRMADTLIPLNGADVILLNNVWRFGEQWGWYWDAMQPVEGLLENQLQWLEKILAQSPNRQAVVAIHSPLDALPPELTGAPGPVHLVQAGYADALNQVLDRHQRVKLVLSGHNHVTSAARHGGRVHTSTSAITEPPFEFRLIRATPRSLRMETLAAIPMDGGIEYLKEKSWVNGRPSDRTVSLTWK
jgi:3',5'-cyclic AMP phosphodiesterase CpdA